MPPKIPVVETVTNAYGFLGRDFATIIRLTWFPLLVVAAVRFASIQFMFPQALPSSGVGSLQASLLGHFSVLGVVGGIITLCGSAMAAVALHRVLLFGDRKPGHFIYFEFGRVEAFFALLPVIGGVIFLAFQLLMLPLMLSQYAALSFLIVPPAIVLMVVITTRLMVIFPVTVVRRRLAFAEAWGLTRGNFWRINLTMALAFVPILIVFMIVSPIFLGLMMDAARGPAGPAQNAAVFDALRKVFIAQAILSYPLSIFFAALGVGLLGNIYKALTGIPPDAVIGEVSAVFD